MDIFSETRRYSKPRARSQLRAELEPLESNQTKPGIEVRRSESAEDFDACLRLRRDVFTIEQGIDPALDNDGLDPQCRHYLVFSANGVPVGTARAHVRSEHAKIGRVAVLQEERSRGMGSAIMRFVLADLWSQRVETAVLSAQLSSRSFYEKLGFVAYGPEYQEAGIAHTAMAIDLCKWNSCS